MDGSASDIHRVEVRDPVVEARGVAMAFGSNTLFRDVTFQVGRGEVFVILGGSGCGKSTLLKLLIGLYPPTAGSIFFDSVDITAERPYARVQRGMSIKMQAPSVFKELPVRQNIQIALQDRLSGAERSAEEERLLSLPGTIVAGKGARRLPNTTCLLTSGWKGETQVMQMDLAGFAISAGSACSSGKVRASGVLQAMGFDDKAAQSAIRISISPATDDDQVNRFADAWESAYSRWRERNG